MQSRLFIWNLAYSVTNKCNLRCAHCYNSAGINNENELDLKEIEECIIIPAARIGTKFITFTGGEPLMRQDFFEILQLTHQAHIQTSIATNGLLLDSKKISKLKKIQVDRVQLSLEGSTDIINDAIRGKGVYKRLTEYVIPELVDAGLFVAVSFTPTIKNAYDIESMAALCAKLKVQSLSIRRFSDAGRAKTNALAISKKQGKEIAHTIYKLREQYKGILSISTGDPTCILADPNLNKYDTSRYLAGCTAGITSIAIDSVGNIKPCTRANFDLGNVLTHDLEDIWLYNTLLNNLRDRNNLIGKCGSCKFNMLCGGCRVEAMNAFGNFLAEDRLCWI